MDLAAGNLSSEYPLYPPVRTFVVYRTVFITFRLPFLKKKTTGDTLIRCEDRDQIASLYIDESHDI